jgi:uncharacterized cupin superfamily protein
MTQVADGVFVSHVDAEDYQPEPEVGGLMHVLREDKDMQAGLWRVPEDHEPVPFELRCEEALLVLEGEIEIAIEGGPTLRLVPGSIASFSKGMRSVVRPERGFKAFWVYS